MTRLSTLQNWVSDQCAVPNLELTPASSDASFRRYFRAVLPDRSVVVMDAPPEHEDCRPFIHVAGLFADVHVPKIHASDLDQGFLLLEDLGSTTYLDVLDADNARALYLDAIDALVRIQLASRPGVLPDYDAALLTREMSLFPDWFAGTHLKKPFTLAQRKVWDEAVELIVANVLAQPKVFVHRDYHSRNLMLSAGDNPGVIDFQDAVYGPITYDLVSLLKDAYVEWDEEFCLDLVIRYWEKARKAGLPVDPSIDQLYRDYEWMGVQRHLKVAGIFARLCHRDGKDGYLNDIPRVLTYLKRACNRYVELRPLGELIRDLSGEVTATGFTF